MASPDGRQAAHPNLTGLMDLVFTEIATRRELPSRSRGRRLAADDDLDAAVPQRLRPSLVQRRAATLAGIQQLTGEGVRSVALRPDRTGRG